MQFHHFIFFDISKEFYALSKDLQENHKQDFHKTIKTHSAVNILPYLTIGSKVNTTGMLWIQSDKIEDTQALLLSLRKSALGPYFTITYTFLGAQRHSIYTSKQTDQEQAIDAAEKLPYFILYPFTKTKEWHFLSAQTRKALMNEHIRIGHTHENIRQNLLYSYGLDDQEFLVSYETEKLEDFQILVMELRADEARRYTQCDTPIFTCVYSPIEKLMEQL